MCFAQHDDISANIQLQKCCTSMQQWLRMMELRSNQEGWFESIQIIITYCLLRVCSPFTDCILKTLSLAAFCRVYSSAHQKCLCLLPTQGMCPSSTSTVLAHHKRGSFMMCIIVAIIGNLLLLLTYSLLPIQTSSIIGC